MFLLRLRFLVIISFLVFVSSHELEFRYHSNEELASVLKNFSLAGDPKLRKNLYDIGYSSGRPKSRIKPSPLWVLELTAAPEGKIGIPNVKLVGNIHGSESGGREILLHFIQYLIDEYGKNDNITWLLDNTRIHILPSLNPDGFAVAKENICHGCALCLGLGVTDEDIAMTGNFPDFFHPNEVLKHAKETLAVMKWMEDVKFILSGSFFGSFIVAIYPYCNKNETFIENPTPDDDVFQYLALTYSNNHANMHKGLSCPGSQMQFDNGVINGASWHNHDADMTDYNYIFRGCMEVRFEISCCKYPESGELENLWNDNRNALIQYCMQANRGVTGQILDVSTNTPVEASMRIVGRDMPFRNFPKTGEFWRILLPGKYVLEVEADGYYTQKHNFTVEDYGEKFPKLTNLTIFLLNATVSTTTTTERTKSTPISSTISKITTKLNTQNRTIQEKPTRKITMATQENTMISEQIRPVRQNNNNDACYHRQTNFLFLVLILILKCLW
ncbi:unnamed protein product [Psylliodes chrysocephalus]|uniref:Peptidase M14 domain-containing protein n=1 Tax=Psylliodes chrysocephalus TaxID=3402493 RepID=A0A9P0D7A7_9CUCU|nr:unnamed protein product [Psylliodes chrysocephala]